MAHLSEDAEGADGEGSVDVIIVGCGMAGLTAAQELLLLASSSAGSARTNWNVTLVESEDRVGGRVEGDRDLVKGHVIDTGAELIHGNGTLLTKLVEDQKWMEKEKENTTTRTTTAAALAPLLEEYFITAHADGGPSAEPTSDGGKFGMYYLNGELLMYDDPKLWSLEQALGQLHHHHHGSEDDQHSQPLAPAASDSLGRVLMPQLSPELQALAVASYGNTAGCCDLDQISLPTLMAFEEYWQNNEEEGDYRISSRVGMHGIAQEMYRELLEDAAARPQRSNNDNFSLTTKLRWRVDRIENDKDRGNDNSRVVVVSTTQEALEADFVIVTPPPPIWKGLFLSSSTSSCCSSQPLPSAKLEAIDRLGMAKAIKCIMVLNRRFWPPKLQSIVMANQEGHLYCPIPEIWFRELKVGEGADESDEEINRSQAFAVVGFMTSTAAERFDGATRTGGGADGSQPDSTTTAATDLLIRQLGGVLSVPCEEIRGAHMATKVRVWEHGYMYPRVGFRVEDLEALAEPVGRIHFAGEATNTNACCTVQAAMETGRRAAEEIWGRVEGADNTTERTKKDNDTS